MKGSCGCGGGGSQGVLTAADLNRNPSRILTAADLNRNPSKILTAKDLNGSSKVLSAADLNRGSRILTAADLNRGGTGVLTAADLNRWREETERRERQFPKLPHIGIEKQIDYSWKPNIWQPVSYGVRLFGAAPIHTASDPQQPTIVIYPSATPFAPKHPDSQMLDGVFPLIVFAHGQCPSPSPLVAYYETTFDPDIYKRWVDTLAPLARAGFIVVIPKLPSVTIVRPQTKNGVNLLPPKQIAVNIWNAEAPIRLLAQTLYDTVQWAREQFNDSIDTAAIGLVGHMEGAYAAAKLLVPETPPDGDGVLDPHPAPTLLHAAAYASLSGSFNEIGGWYNVIQGDPSHHYYVPTLRQLATPSLFMIGAAGFSGEDGARDENDVNAIGIFDWDGIGSEANAIGAKHKHGVVFNGGHPYDYLHRDPDPSDPTFQPAQPHPPDWTGGGAGYCDAAANVYGAPNREGQGACPGQWLLARDVLVTFFSKYVPPPSSSWVSFYLDESLLPPTIGDLENLNQLRLGNKEITLELAQAIEAEWQPKGPIWAADNYLNGVASFLGNTAEPHCVAQFAWAINIGPLGPLNAPPNWVPATELIWVRQLGPGDVRPGPAALVDTGWTDQMPKGVHPVLPQGGLFICRDGDGFYAMSSICTHQQCDLAFSSALICGENFIECGCHQSIFNLNGEKVGGPLPNVPIDAMSGDPEIVELAVCPNKDTKNTGPALFALQHYAVVKENGKFLVDMSQPVPGSNRY